MKRVEDDPTNPPRIDRPGRHMPPEEAPDSSAVVLVLGGRHVIQLEHRDTHVVLVIAGQLHLAMTQAEAKNLAAALRGVT